MEVGDSPSTAKLVRATFDLYHLLIRDPSADFPAKRHGRRSRCISRMARTLPWSAHGSRRHCSRGATWPRCWKPPQAWRSSRSPGSVPDDSFSPACAGVSQGADQLEESGAIKCGEICVKSYVKFKHLSRDRRRCPDCVGAQLQSLSSMCYLRSGGRSLAGVVPVPRRLK